MNETTDPTTVLADPTPPPMPPSATAFDNLSTRDVFAMFALQGVLASHTGEVELPDAKKAAKWSVEYADALLTELHNTTFPG